MAIEQARKYLAEKGYEDRVMELDHSSATVAEAAEALGCEEKQIAKTLSFLVKDTPILIVAAGDAKVDNKKYKSYFGVKAKMIPGAEVEEIIGHAPGGVCPFAIRPKVEVYLDESLKRFEIVYPAAGSANSAVRLNITELEICAESKAWIDVCKGWNSEEAE